MRGIAAHSLHQLLNFTGGAASKPLAKRFYGFVYLNGWLSLLGSLSYGITTQVIGFKFSLPYLLFLVCGIQVAYGIDNLRDIAEDKDSWKSRLVPINNYHAQNGLILFIAAFGILGILIWIFFFIKMSLWLCIPLLGFGLHALFFSGGKTSLSSFSAGETSLSGKTGGFLKVLCVSGTWIFMLVLLPLFLQNSVAPAGKVGLWLLLISPCFASAVALTEFRDRFKNETTFGPMVGREVNKMVPILLLIYYVILFEIGIQLQLAWIWKSSIAVGLYVYFAQSIWRANRYKIRYDIMADSLGGVPLLLAWILM